MNKRIDAIWHLFLYLGLAVGGVAVYLSQTDSLRQFQVLLLLVTFYLLWGFAYHHYRGDIAKKIMMEYLMIALIALGAGYLVLVS